jgi:hypothetical protein
MEVGAVRGLTISGVKTMSENGIIDLTNVVEKMRSTFVLAAKEYLMGLLMAIPGLGPFAMWFARVLGGRFIDWVLGRLSEWSVMQAFFMNTAIRKGTQAASYVKKVDAKEQLPLTATDEEYEKAERDELAAFDVLVSLKH